MDRICRICSSPKLEQFLDLGPQPWCNDFVVHEQVGLENLYPLDLYFCKDCTTVQVRQTVPKEVMYNEHLYLSGITRSMRKHFQQVSDKAVQLTGRGLVVDIGSNDGTLLSTYLKHDMNVLGIEPCSKAAKIAIGNGINTDINFFNHKCANKIEEKKGKAKIISAANVFYHVEELHDIVKGIKNLLDDDGVFVMQGSYLPRIMEKRAFDIMYHEHLLYYRVDTLKYLLDIYNLEIFDIDEAPVHGGSIVAYICHKGTRHISDKIDLMIKNEISDRYDQFDTYQKFADNIRGLRDKIRETVIGFASAGRKIFAFGAPAKGTVLLNYCGLNNDHIVCAVEKNQLKVGRYIPGTGIPIYDEDTVEEPDYYLLLPWNFVDEFCESEAFVSGKRKFIVPIPEVKVLSHAKCVSSRE